MLNSCIEAEEEVWVNADASGRARFEVTAPTLLFAKFGGIEKIIAGAKEGAASSQNVTLTEISAQQKGTKTRFLAEVQFQDARKMSEFVRGFRDPLDSAKKCQEEILFGELDLDLRIPNLNYSRVIDISSLLPPESNSPLAQRLLGDAQVTYRLHLPSAAQTHNATRISKEGCTLEWQIPVRDFLKGPVKMSFTAPLPRLSLYLTVAASVLLLLGGFFFAVLRKSLFKKRSVTSVLPS